MLIQNIESSYTVQNIVNINECFKYQKQVSSATVKSRHYKYGLMY